ncbi:aspartyl/glutamyl-tRNA(Asn/Gln) amidotransferase subunit B [Anaerobranca californiensis DSM 14826]|jgi:aspartyl-tRNA(Asn)/glutamyl-tRNA(Gln) amidotransferase subunit B|uniref:Aspartyl/glutamyl-tRNA(Asn/Gln) amidotransferase subunit B n=1 Tax=Anaerobranca californiensis DSM 14826 TaxID=1120989 RepID=A0A1M6PYH2_9FIRM|nr:Asp-tRNA(Asn)/Glu-tRNA(Gln) amidotransferase subunit GatB [Anaerobranca californiensis]SHK12988.1 aspartyl/glutamyl-tRNA(Asn/Gln) amidotransferase subunit B [Anaerobranca californiensis DSM 14826]
MDYRSFSPVIGLEVHVELATKTKGFCGCLNKFGLPPNTNTCPVCLGLPGALPVLNEKVVELAVKAGLLLNCKIQRRSGFDRKNYFYPDLVKGYQITQYYQPIAVNGFLDYETKGNNKRIKIERIHIEEDTGKVLYQRGRVLLDYNRSGIPLIEIVTAPDFSNAEEVKDFLETLRLYLLHGEISHCKMEEGNIRVDVNISLAYGDEIGVKREIKNLNSFNNVEKAIIEETNRQIKSLISGGKLKRETLKWDEEKNTLVTMREKETSSQYMYFPEYDLPQLVLTKEFVQGIENNLPKPLIERGKKLKELGLAAEDVEFLIKDKELLKLYEETIKYSSKGKEIFNIFKGNLMRYLKEKDKRIQDLKLNPEKLASFITDLNRLQYSSSIKRQILFHYLEGKKELQEILKLLNLIEDRDEEEILQVVKKVIEGNPQGVEDYLKGKNKVLGYFMGQIMKMSKGFNPEKVKEILIKELNKLEKK